MIKNLLNADEDPPPEIKDFAEETAINSPTQTQISESPATDDPSEIFEGRQVFEIPESAKFFAKPTEIRGEINHIPDDSESTAEPLVETVNNEFTNAESPEIEAADSPFSGQFDNEKTNDDSAPTIFQSEYKPASTAETVRQSGLAYSAAIILFVSVVFMLVIGWFADLLLGSSPWGIVGGIILGAIIGFVQFFRITSQIFKK